MHAQRHQVWVFVISGLLLAGCAANVGKTIKVSDEQATKYGALSAADAIAALEKRVDEAKNANMPYFAPNHFRGASEILASAQKSAAKKPKNELIGEIAKADAILDKGQTMMAIVQSRLVNEFALKIQLDKDNVAKVYPKEYDKVVSELASLIEKVELEKADKIDKDKIELMQKMQALDVKAIQYTALHESEVINEETQSKDGEELAPATFAEALRVYQSAKDRIAQAPHDDEVVRRAGADATFAARHARHVSWRVQYLQNKFETPVEPIVLEEEKRLLAITTALGQQDLRDQAVEKQADDIVKTAGEIMKGQQSSKQAIGAVSEERKVFESRLKEAGAQLAEKDARINTLNEQIAQLTAQNNTLLAAKSSKAKPAKKASGISPAK